MYQQIMHDILSIKQQLRTWRWCKNFMLYL